MVLAFHSRFKWSIELFRDPLPDLNRDCILYHFGSKSQTCYIRFSYTPRLLPYTAYFT